MKAKKITSVVAIFMMIAVFVLPLSPAATAVLEEKGSITLHLTNTVTNKPLANISFRLYFVAEAYEEGIGVRYEMNPPYDEANIDMSNLQDSMLPIHLMHFAVSRSLPYTEKSTNDKGIVVFDKLTPGLYLVAPSDKDAFGQIAMPFVVSVPTHNLQNGTLDFNINASPKIFDNMGENEGIKTYISVVKKWETDKKHPMSITVVLLRNFQEYAKVELNAGNNWYHRFDNLSPDYIWNVVEENVPDGYTVSYDTSSNTVAIINKSDDIEEENTTGDGKPEGSTGEGEKPGEGTTNPPEEETEEDKLVHTGQLNWPVPVCAISGLLIFSIGWAVLNFGKKESE